jgi:hypothetical protein
MAAVAKSWRREGRRECVLINAQIRGPLSGQTGKDLLTSRLIGFDSQRTEVCG